ncbi:hypothetical protein RGAI101_2948 [Roseobacter sp. GAI101]|nr:hypothetical protein RGAI101_2948 [Roseobacter sp. GAI101]
MDRDMVRIRALVNGADGLPALMFAPCLTAALP